MRQQSDLFPGVGFDADAEKDERYTPRWLFDPLNLEFRFNLDVCATAESAKCPRFFTQALDGLTKSWAGERAWCNPPWSNIAPWVEKAREEMRAGCDLVVHMVPTRTDQDWWQRHVEPYRDGRGAPVPGVTLTTRFLEGRIPFGCPGNPEAVGAGSPNFWVVLLVWERAR